MQTTTHGTASMSAGQMMELGAAVLRQLPRDITPEQAQSWIQNQTALQAALRQALIPTPTNGQVAAPVLVDNSTYSVCINYELPLKAMIKPGRFDWVNDNIIAKNFPRSKKRGLEEVTIELMKMESDDIIGQMEVRAFRPATIEELLVLGAKFPELQLEFSICALGSVWELRAGRRGVPCLYEDGDGRVLGLRWWRYGWSSHDRFAVVRK